MNSLKLICGIGLSLHIRRDIVVGLTGLCSVDSAKDKFTKNNVNELFLSVKTDFWFP